MSGLVSFVSSGPGDPELLTLKAVDRLRRAEAVLYDDLSSVPALAHAPEAADLISVGKRAGRRAPRQHHVSGLLVDYARAGRRVVRLKSGDAGIFGRLEEEVEALARAGIAFEVVPGVTAASAAAAAAGIPLTRRLKARRLQFVTGHDVTGALPDDLNMAALADPGAVTAVFMGRRTFAELARRLIAGGLPADTPALLGESVSLPEERLIRDTVAGLAQRIGADAGDGPVLILIGPLMTAR